MRILHTADWHLGHRLYNRDRTEEHRAALDWLLGVIEEEEVDVLVVAGDVFDISNPSNQARELYFDFLTRLVHGRCRAAVIVGGNHDSPSMLDAPRGLMQALQLHVIGAARLNPDDRIIRIDLDGEGLIVAAIPYLRERDLRTASFGESVEDRLDALRQGILTYFSEAGAAACRARAETRHPILATGHLYAGGAEEDAEKPTYIYQADEQNIQAAQFPDCFDYVALGHIHRAQHVGDLNHVRYAGSLIPLTFVEGQRARTVRLVEIAGAGEAVTSRKIEVPAGRPLYRLHGTLEEVKAGLLTAVATPREGPTAWAEVKVFSDRPLPNLYETLTAIVRGANATEEGVAPLEILRLGTERITAIESDGPVTDNRQLDEVRPEEIFADLCRSRGYDPDTVDELQEDFAGLRNWMEERSRA